MASKTVADAVRSHLDRLKRGTVFTPAELVHARLGSEDAVRQILRRLAAAGKIRRLSKGYYDLPRTSPRIGVLSPTPEAIIAAHERKTGATIERPEIDAVNKLGLTTQVVARPVCRTNLFSRDLNIGGQRIRLRTVGPRSLSGDKDDPVELVIDALRAIGKAHISVSEIVKLRAFVREHNLQKRLRQKARRASAWMLSIIETILTDDEMSSG